MIPAFAVKQMQLPQGSPRSTELLLGPEPLQRCLPACLVAIAAAGALSAAPLCAQEAMNGVVVDSATGAAISAAVVVSLDLAGRERGRVLTGAQGEFRLPFDTAVVQLRVLRMGFRPRAVPMAGFDKGQLARAEMVRLPQLMSRVSVRSNRSCPRQPDDGLVFSLWEQARIGLVASVVAREATKARSTILVYERTLDEADSVSQQTVRTVVGEWSRPFGAAFSAEAFAEHGFVERHLDGRRTFFAPDADVLLETAFLDAYCFSLSQAVAHRPQQVGLRFVPAKRRHNRTDVDGTLWIDTADRVLRDIDYRYVGLERGSDRYGPGGVISFREMSNGVLVVERWSIRMVTALVERTAPLSKGGATGHWGERAAARFAVSEGGGELAEASWPDGATWQGHLGEALVRVVDSAGAPIAGALVRLDSTDYARITDSTGAARFVGLLPGPYRATAADSVMRVVALDLGSAAYFHAARDSSSSVTIRVASPHGALTKRCGVKKTTSRILAALIVDETGIPIPMVRWRVGRSDGITGADGLVLACALEGVQGESAFLALWRNRRGSSIAPMLTRAVPLKSRVTTVRVTFPTSP